MLLTPSLMVTSIFPLERRSLSSCEFGELLPPPPPRSAAAELPFAVSGGSSPSSSCELGASGKAPHGGAGGLRRVNRVVLNVRVPIVLHVVDLPNRPKAVKLLVQLRVAGPGAQAAHPDAGGRRRLPVADLALELANVLPAHLHLRPVRHVEVEELDEGVGVALAGRRPLHVHVLDDAVALKDPAQVGLRYRSLEVAHKERSRRLVVLLRRNVVEELRFEEGGGGGGGARLDEEDIGGGGERCRKPPPPPRIGGYSGVRERFREEGTPPEEEEEDMRS
ncbi:hypothetical protein TYRP_002772 [Tyrophagus putrescentiae]|nr:hypothetical protein TYRP_002772 [Tyrophagus putrescentiae]